ncbi:MAG: DNA-processing protein DprA [Eubacterium sp.]|nr:DNA-processing protein DprA [Candidatus Colimonas fimequi]
MNLKPEIQAIHDEAGIVTITIDDPGYPEKLKGIDNPPKVLYALGDVSLLNAEKHSAVIGTRAVTMKGMDVAIGIGNMLAMAGEVVVSGLADGCDTGGHLGALGGGGKTIAILPYAITEIPTDRQRQIAGRIVDGGGLLVSEYAHGTPSDDEFYAARDRLQAAMSEGLIVVESQVDEGTMVTVAFAEEMGKLLGAYRHPGGFDMTDTSEGNEYLIKERGVRPITNMKSVNKFMDDMNEIRRNK